MKPAALFVLVLVADLSVAQMQWVLLSRPRIYGGSVAFDTRRDRAVAIGLDGHLWEFEAGSPVQRSGDPAVGSPAFRVDAAMTYDEARGHVLMFGGANDNGALGDTWSWDGFEWRQVFAVVAPPRRERGSMVFDPVRQRVLLFGGSDPGRTLLLDDTWEHDGTSWARLSPATVPTAMWPLPMAFDRRRGVAVLVGVDRLGLRHLFEWNGSDWIERTPPGFDLLGIGAIVYDPVRQRVVMIRSDYLGASPAANVLEWDGVALRTVGSMPAMDERGVLSAWFEPSLGATIVIGGGSSRERSDAWIWNGTAATRLRADEAPPMQTFPFLQNDELRVWMRDPVAGESVLYGGSDPSFADETWSWDGSRWRWLATNPTPARRTRAAATTDLLIPRGLLFGGEDELGALRSDLWAVQGGVWTMLSGNGPARSSAGLVVDEARGAVLLFGGIRGNSYLGDMWEWNGVAWVAHAVTPRPSPRRNPAMCYDDARQRVVLVGGWASAPLADTWEWDGTRWQSVATPTIPTPSPAPSVAFDRVRRRSVLAAWDELSGPDPHVDLFEYDGVDWTLIDTRISQHRILVSWDERRQRIVGWSADGALEWTPTAAVASSFGAACGASVGRLGVRSRPRIGDVDFGLECEAGAGGAALFALSASAGNAQIGGCPLLLGPVLATSVQLAGAGGIAVLRLPLPQRLALRGLVLFAQAGTIAPGRGLSTTPGLRVQVGD